MIRYSQKTKKERNKNGFLYSCAFVKKNETNYRRKGINNATLRVMWDRRNRNAFFYPSFKSLSAFKNFGKKPSLTECNRKNACLDYMEFEINERTWKGSSTSLDNCRKIKFKRIMNWIDKLFWMALHLKKNKRIIKQIAGWSYVRTFVSMCIRAPDIFLNMYIHRSW